MSETSHETYFSEPAERNQETTYNLSLNDSFIIKNRYYPYPPFADYTCEILGNGINRTITNTSGNLSGLEGGSSHENLVFQFTKPGTYNGEVKNHRIPPPGSYKDIVVTYPVTIIVK